MHESHSSVEKYKIRIGLNFTVNSEIDRFSKALNIFIKFILLTEQRFMTHFSSDNQHSYLFKIFFSHQLLLLRNIKRICLWCSESENFSSWESGVCSQPSSLVSDNESNYSICSCCHRSVNFCKQGVSIQLLPSKGQSLLIGIQLTVYLLLVKTDVIILLEKITTTTKALRSSSQKSCQNNRDLCLAPNLKTAEVVEQGSKLKDILNKLEELDPGWIFLTILNRCWSGFVKLENSCSLWEKLTGQICIPDASLAVKQSLTRSSECGGNCRGTVHP